MSSEPMNVREHHLIAQLQHGTGRKSQRLVLDRNVRGVGLNGDRALFNVSYTTYALASRWTLWNQRSANTLSRLICSSACSTI